MKEQELLNTMRARMCGYTRPTCWTCEHMQNTGSRIWCNKILHRSLLRENPHALAAECKHFTPVPNLIE